jgi:hypothetical protein
VARLSLPGAALVTGALVVGCGTAPSHVEAGSVQLRVAAPVEARPAPVEARPAPVLVRHTGRRVAAAPLEQAVSRMPVAGECEEATSAPEAVVELAADAPYPRCQVVRADQRLRVVNATGIEGEPAATIVVTFGRLAPRTLSPGEQTVFDQRVADLLAPGVHRLHTDFYNGSDAELWLRG